VKLRLGPVIADVSNLNSRNEVRGERSKVRLLQPGNRLWPTDSSFKHLPARASLLYARSIPAFGGRTEVADVRTACEGLPDDMKHKLEGLVA